MASPHHASLEPEIHDHIKYLGLLEIAFFSGVKVVAKIYEFVKERSGPLKSHVDAVEKTIWDIFGPIFYHIEETRYKIVLYADKKVAVVVGAVESHIPHKVKETSYAAIGIASQIPDLLVAVVSDVHKSGFVETSKGYFAKFEPVAEDLAYYVWKQYLKLPYSVKAVHVVAPPSLSIAKKLNQFVAGLKTKQLPLVHYVPLLPVQRIETVLKRDV